MEQFKSGFVYGTGAAVDVELGYVPDRVEVINVTDGDVSNLGFPSTKTMAITSGSVEIKVGDTITGQTSGATAKVKQVLVDTGSWAGGDAAGSLILDADTESGTFAAEAIISDRSTGTDDATGAATADVGIDIDTEVAGDTGISAYLGSAGSASKGFTMATAVSEDAKLMKWSAWRQTG